MIIVIGIISVLCFAAALALLFLYLPAKKELQFAADKNKELFDALGKANVQNASLEADLRNKTDLNLKYAEEIKEKESSFEALNKELTSAKEEAARLRADVANAENFKTEQEKNFNALQNAAKEQFKNMADSLLKQKTEELKGTNKELLNPFSERLDKLQDKLARMQDLNENLAQEASSLTKALTYNKIQGNFGEVTLERILQNCGLKEGENYRKQVHLKDDGGKDKIPDFIIDLPDGRYIVVDSKMSLTAYNNFVNEQDEEKKNAFLKEHIKSVEDHIKELSAQNYQDLKDVRGKSPDFVIMYVPLEYAYLTALEAKKDLGIFASNSKVAVATATFLLLAKMPKSFLASSAVR